MAHVYVSLPAYYAITAVASLGLVSGAMLAVATIGQICGRLAPSRPRA
jgi:hypothetical protein